MRKILFFMLSVMLIGLTKGQTFSLLTTMNTDKLGSQPTEKLTIGSITYFTVDDGIHGRELWKTDGTYLGTQLVKDIYSGNSSSGIQWLFNLNGMLLFIANDGINGNKVWRSDGTDAGTIIISPTTNKAYNRKTDGDNFKPIIYNNLLYYFGTDPVNGGNEVWKTDGSTVGTTILKDISTLPDGYSWSVVGLFTIVNNKLYFIQNSSASTGFEIWKTDGTNVGTTKVTNLTSTLSKLTKAGNNLYFVAEAFGLINLYVIDGNTFSVRNTEVLLSVPENMFECKGNLLFTKSNISSGNEIWVSNGFGTNSTILKDINTTGSSNASNFTTIDTITYFIADDGINGLELWKTGGSALGTTLVKDINVGSLGSFDVSTTKQLYNLNGVLYFVANNGISGKEIWKSDGTPTGTLLLKDAYAGCQSNSPSYLILNGASIYTGTNGNTGQELWKCDTVINGNATLLRDIKVNNEQTIASVDNKVIPIDFNGELIFSGISQTSGAELYKVSSYMSSPQMVRDIFTNCYSSNPSQFTRVDSTIFFTASNNLGTELWKTDGTNAGTVFVKDINSGIKGSNPKNLVSYNGKLFFLATDSTNTLGLWVSDGTGLGTTKIYTLNTSYQSVDNLTNVNGFLFFSGSYLLGSSNPKTSLFISDGSTSGTYVVKTFNSYGLFSCNVLNGKFIFGMNEQTTSYGQELWISDGTISGTKILKDINKGNGTGFYAGTKPLIDSNIMYFQGIDSTYDIELWKTDGTTAGTIMIKNIDTVISSSSSPDNFVKLNGNIYFSATTTNDGRELWKTDGTESGTILVKDIALTSLSSNPSNLTQIGNYIYFFASDSGAGAYFNNTSYTQNIWRTDGSNAGTIKTSSFNGFLGLGVCLIKSGTSCYAIASTPKDGYNIWGADFNSQISNISGRVITPKSNSVKNAKINLTGTTSNLTNTDSIGFYRLSINSANYTIRPTKNNDIKKNNGVSSIDVILTQNHILNKIKLNSPYKIIAADVNNNKSISNIDIIFMKRLILGIDTTFTGNRLWAFVDSAYQFPDTTNPFPYKDSISFTNLTSNKTNQTFIGVKLGDVNYDWNPALARGVAAKPMELVYELRSALKVRPDGKNGTDFQSDLIHIPISVKNFKNLTALQYTLHFIHKNYEFVGIENNKLGIEFNEKQATRNGSISFLWADSKGKEHSLEDGNEIFTIVFKSKLGISNEELGLSLSNDITEIEAWDKDYQQHHIILTQRETKNDKQETRNEWFVIYPNPTHSTIKIKLDNLVGVGTVVITDVYGKIVFKKNINQPVSTVNTLGFAKGVYLVSVIGEQRKQTQKLIVE